MRLASITRLGKGWRAQIKRAGLRESATFPSAAQARAWAATREHELADARAGILPVRTVAQALTRYSTEVSPRHRGQRWEQVRLAKLGRELPFAGKRIAEVSPADIAGWRDAQGRTLAPASVRREFGLLRAVFAVALREWGWLRVSPFEAVRQPPPGRPRDRRVSDDELGAIVAALGWDQVSRPRRSGQYVAAAALWALATAMRQGEILALTRADVDVAGRVARIVESKNGEGRAVPLARAALALLELLPERGRLFPVASSVADTLWRRARKAAGVGDVRFHDLRREATTRMAGKVDVLTLARITGHRDLKILLRTYYAPAMSEVAARLD